MSDDCQRDLEAAVEALDVCWPAGFPGVSEDQLRDLAQAVLAAVPARPGRLHPDGACHGNPCRYCGALRDDLGPSDDRESTEAESGPKPGPADDTDQQQVAELRALLTANLTLRGKVALELTRMAKDWSRVSLDKRACLLRLAEELDV